MSINAIGDYVTSIQMNEIKSPFGDSETSGPSFLEMVKNQIDTVDALLGESDKKATEVATGKSENLHEAMISYEKAESALKLLVQVRNKALDAYNEVLRMQV